MIKWIILGLFNGRIIVLREMIIHLIMLQFSRKVVKMFIRKNSIPLMPLSKKG